MELEIRHLQALVAVADTGTFGKAAEQLGFTQSAVSQQVAALERAVGTTVFDRPGGPRPVRLTEAGEVLLEHARAVLTTLRGALADVDAMTSGMRGRLRVGTIQSVGTQVLPGLLTRFAAERPSVEIELHEAHDPADLLARVEAQELDVTFCNDTTGDGPFTSRLVLEDPYVVLAPATPEWLERQVITLEELATFPLLGSRNASCCAQTLAAFGDIETRYVLRSDDNSTIQGCVTAGLGVALTPMLTIDVDDPTTTIVPVVPRVPPRQIAVAWHSGRRPSALLDAFVDATLAACADVAATWSSEIAA